MSLTIENLPPYEAISHEAIRDAVAQLSVAASTKETARKDLVELEQTREAAEWHDAEAAEQSRAESKPEPKRTHVAAHDKKTDVARHEQKVADLAHTRARAALQAALDEHGEAWADELTTSVTALCLNWDDSVSGLIELHARLSLALSVARTVVGKQPHVATVSFPAREIHDLEIAGGQKDPHGVLDVASVLGALSRVLEPAPEPTPVEPRPLPVGQGSSLLRGRGDVEAELAATAAFVARAGTPEGIAEREAAVAARRARRETHERSNAEAVAIEAAGTAAE